MKQDMTGFPILDNPPQETTEITGFTNQAMRLHAPEAITDADRRALFALAKHAHGYKSVDIIKAALVDMRLMYDTRKIPKSKYAELLERIRQYPNYTPRKLNMETTS